MSRKNRAVQDEETCFARGFTRWIGIEISVTTGPIVACDYSNKFSWLCFDSEGTKLSAGGWIGQWGASLWRVAVWKPLRTTTCFAIGFGNWVLASETKCLAWLALSQVVAHADAFTSEQGPNPSVVPLRKFPILRRRFGTLSRICSSRMCLYVWPWLGECVVVCCQPPCHPRGGMLLPPCARDVSIRRWPSPSSRIEDGGRLPSSALTMAPLRHDRLVSLRSRWFKWLSGTKNVQSDCRTHLKVHGTLKTSWK